MILVGLGGNVSGPWGTPRQTIERALLALDRGGTRLVKASRLLMTSPFGQTAQPPFVNAVAIVETHLPPEALLMRLHAIEAAAGRPRGRRWGPRTLDLDLLDYHGLTRRGRPRLPHPGLAFRPFVLAPIAEIAPSWKHPTLHRSAASLLRGLRSGGEGSEL